jgi:hypothetical protein
LIWTPNATNHPREHGEALVDELELGQIHVDARPTDGCSP